MRRQHLLVLLAVYLFPEPSLALIGAEVIASGLTSPVFATAPTGDTRLFILERAGTIRILEDGILLPAAFLDISTQVSTLNVGGLLGLAFPSDYLFSGLFYVYYTRTDDHLVLSRFQISASPNVANDTTEEVLLDVPNPDLRHNGGTIAFSPIDGYLYLAIGDGGGGGLFDPNENSQNMMELRGKILRLDVSGGPDVPASIPPTNPFVMDPEALDEIWAIGLRNPYRWSFDRLTGDLWLADVGEDNSEEVNFHVAGAPGGANYGWDIMEGTLCNTIDPSTAFPCNDPELTLPVHEYDHSNGDCSVIGGNVYRGRGVEHGLYFFGDFCTTKVWSLDPATFDVTERTPELVASLPPGATIDRIASFGEDGDGNLLIVDSFGGEVFRIRASVAVPALTPSALFALCIALAATATLRYRRILGIEPD
jgi:glucose/arabinose dehydrogenase